MRPQPFLSGAAEAIPGCASKKRRSPFRGAALGAIFDPPVKIGNRINDALAKLIILGAAAGAAKLRECGIRQPRIFRCRLRVDS